MTKRRAKYEWDAEKIKALREHMGLSQQALMYKPRRSTGNYLSLVADRAGFEYASGGEEESKEEAKP